MMNNVKNKRLIWTVLFMWLYFLTPIRAASEDSVDVQEIVFSHIQDAYTWHITEWNGKEIAIPLPVLIKSEERGWDLFLSHHLHQNQIHNNYYIATDGEYAGKIVEKNSLGAVAYYCSLFSGQLVGTKNIPTKSRTDLQA